MNSIIHLNLKNVIFHGIAPLSHLKMKINTHNKLSLFLGRIKFALYPLFHCLQDIIISLYKQLKQKVIYLF